MILLDPVVEILDLTQFARGWHGPGGFELGEGLGIRRIFVNCDYAGRDGMRRCELLGEKPLGGLGIPCRAQQNLQRVPRGVHRSVQIHPDPLHLDVGFIHPPGIGRRFELRAAASVEFGGLLLDQAKDRFMIDTEPALSHYLFEVAIAQRIPHVPAYAQENNLRLKMTPFERALGIHELDSSSSPEYPRVYMSVVLLATQNFYNRAGPAALGDALKRRMPGRYCRGVARCWAPSR
jgi:hypothetical protein